MAKTSKGKKKKVTARRLVEMKPLGTSFVPFGANGMAFSVTKELPMSGRKLDIAALVKAHDAFTQVVNVIKAGEPDEAALASLCPKMDQVAQELTAALGQQAVAAATGPLTQAGLDLKVLKDGLFTLTGQLKQMGVEAMAMDYNLADRLDTLTGSAQALFDQIANVKVTKTDPEPAKPVEPAPAPAAPAVTPAAPAVEPAPAPVPAPAPAPAVVTPAPEQAKTDPANPAVQAPAPTPAPAAPVATPAPAAPAPVAPVAGGVTKADLESFAAGLLKSIDEKIAAAVKVTKSDPGAGSDWRELPGTQPTVTPAPSAPQVTEADMFDRFDLTQSPELKNIKLPGGL